jgi:hypothetical protein
MITTKIEMDKISAPESEGYFIFIEINDYDIYKK